MNLTIQDLLRIEHKNQRDMSLIPRQKKFREVSTDTRALKKGDLFIALRGEQYDGHNFILKAEAQGAIAVIVDEKWFKGSAKKQLRSKLPLLVVKDTLESYGELANLYRKKFSIPILLIAGSNGKTTTKEVISHVLGTSLNVLKTEANYNNQVGLPRMLLHLNPEHDIAVLEIGTNHPGEIGWLTRIAEPTMGLITNIGREHLEFFKNIKGVAKEELALFDYLHAKQDGVVFINCDDPLLSAQSRRFSWLKVRPYGKGSDAKGKSLGFTADGKLKIEIELGPKRILLNSHLIADYTPSLFAGAANVAVSLGFTRAKIKNALASYKPYSKRMEIVSMRGGVTIINDTYNANPESFFSALQTLKNIPAKGKKYVVSGDMFELGSTSKREHALLGKKMASYKFTHAYFTGSAMKGSFASYVKTNGKLHATFATAKAEIALALRDILKKGDVVLLKGSRGMKMEEILEHLRMMK